MEYISAEEFLKQPKEVQKVFLNWWEIDDTDLITDEYGDIQLASFLLAKKEFTKQPKRFKNKYVLTSKDESFKPNLVEGQLRKFIEDKTGLLLEVQNFGKSGYCIHLNNNEWVEKQYNNLGIDLLQAYWKVALEKAKEEIKED